MEPPSLWSARYVKLDGMPGGRPRVLTADQIERATLLRHVGLSIADCAAEVHANRETLREQFIRDGTVPRPQPYVSTSSELPPTSEDAPVDDAGFPASVAPTPAASLPSAPPVHNGWATDWVMSEVLAGRGTRLVQSMDEADHRKFDSPVDEAYPSNRRDLDG